MIIGFTQGAFAVSITAPANASRVEVPINVNTTMAQFEGAQFTLSFSGGLTYNSSASSTATTGALGGGSLMGVERDGNQYIVIFAPGDKLIKPVNGYAHIATLVFNYSGNAPQTVSITEIKVSRLVDNDTTEAGYPNSIEYTITRGEGGGGGDDSGGPGGPGGGGGSTGGDPGGTTTDPVVTPPDDPTRIGDTGGPGGRPDVQPGIVYAPFIKGYPDGTVKPDGQLTRAELAQIIFNLYGTGTANEADYTDVQEGYWAYNVIGFCQAKGYMVGYPDGSFNPEATVTRAELGTAFVRIKNLEMTAEHPFSDVGDHWGLEYIGASFAGGMILGYPDGTFRPDNPVTRAEAVTMICRAEERDENLFDMTNTFSDLSADFWGYKYIMNAANGYNNN